MTLPPVPPCGPVSPALSVEPGASLDPDRVEPVLLQEPLVDDTSTRPRPSRRIAANRELEDLLAYLEQRRAPHLGERFAVIRWALKVECYQTREAALEASKRLPRSRRVGLLDRRTGETWARNRTGYQVIKQAFGALLVKPLRFMGVI